MKLYFLFYLLFSLSLFSKPFEVGSEWNLLEFTDQNDKKVDVNVDLKSTDFILSTFSNRFSVAYPKKSIIK